MTTLRTALTTLMAAAIIIAGSPAHADRPTSSRQPTAYGSNRAGWLFIGTDLVAHYAPRRDAVAACNGRSSCEAAVRKQYAVFVQLRDARLDAADDYPR